MIMPKSKTIEIDEIVTPEKAPGGDSKGHKKKPERPQPADGVSRPEESAPDNPFADFQKALPWKARLTLKATQWFMILRSKSWGKLVIVPAIILALLLALPLGVLAIFVLIIRSFLKSFSR